MWVYCEAERCSTPPVWGAVDSLANQDLQPAWVWFNPPVNHISLKRPPSHQRAEDSLYASLPTRSALHSGSVFHCSPIKHTAGVGGAGCRVQGGVAADIVPAFCVGSGRQHLPCRDPARSPAAPAAAPQLTRGTSGEGMMVLMKPAWSNFFLFFFLFFIFN